MNRLPTTIIAVLFASCISLNTLASTITVSQDGTGYFITIQDAIDAAEPDDGLDRIIVSPKNCFMS